MIELNADIGEGCNDAALMPYLARVSIACGGHAGDAVSMEAALRLAGEYGVAVGAHPSYPDRVHFGRKPVTADPEEVVAWVTQQIETLAESAAALGLRLAHVKPHGALYNVAAVDHVVAQAVVRAAAAVDPSLVVVGLSGSRLIVEAQAARLGVMNEAFADRRYLPSGQLVSRETEGAVVTDPALAATQARSLAEGAPITTLHGTALRVPADTLCLHSDTPNALNIARAVHAALYHR